MTGKYLLEGGGGGLKEAEEEEERGRVLTLHALADQSSKKIHSQCSSYSTCPSSWSTVAVKWDSLMFNARVMVIPPVCLFC